MIGSLKVSLFESDELLSLYSDLIISAKSYLELPIFSTFGLLPEDRIKILVKIIILVICLMNFHLCKLSQSIFCTLDENVSRLLKSNGMRTVIVINFVLYIFVNEPMFSEQEWFLGVF